MLCSAISIALFYTLPPLPPQCPLILSPSWQDRIVALLPHFAYVLAKSIPVMTDKRLLHLAAEVRA